MSTDIVPVRTDGRQVVSAAGQPVAPIQHYQEPPRRVPAAGNGDPGTIAARRELIHFINRTADAQGYCDAALLAVGNGLLSSGYQLPKGVIVQAAEASEMLAAAREAEIPQQYITRFFEIMGRRQNG